MLKLNSNIFKTSKSILIILFSSILIASCNPNKSVQKDEQIVAIGDETNSSSDSLSNSISNNLVLSQISISPSEIIISGNPNYRLLPVYKTRKASKGTTTIYDDVRKIASSSYDEYSGSDNMLYTHYMPGIDIHYGYKLLNISHYNYTNEKKSFLFSKPVLIKSIYYPSFTPDSISKVPVIRNYYLISVYDNDTNKDTLINRRDLRHFYSFSEDALKKTQLIPDNYSVFRSQYDYGKDIMYIFAKQDLNKNGSIDENEPTHVFWIDLKNPQPAKLFY